MDRSKPFRRLLPVGILSAAGFAGCASAPAYRPVVTAQAPAGPLATAQAPANSSPVPVAPSLGAPIEPAPAAPPMDPPPRPDLSATPAAPASEPSVSSGPGLNAPGPVLNAPGLGGVQPYLSAPMGVLQTPLTPPPAPPATAPENGQPLTAPQLPSDAAVSGPAQSSVSVNIDAEHSNGTAATDAAQKPASKKSKPAKPADPPLSPLARLRKRFHSFTHPAPKMAVPEGDSKPVAAAQVTVARPVSGYRTPLPTPEVAVKVATPPVHGLYASDDVDTTRPVVSDVKTARAEPGSQQAQSAPPLSITPSTTATNPVANNEIEQWPFSAPATATTSAPNPQTADSNDFTAISGEDYRASTAQIEHTSGPTIIASPSLPAPAPSAEPTPSNNSSPPTANFLLGPGAPSAQTSPVTAPPTNPSPTAALPVTVPTGTATTGTVPTATLPTDSAPTAAEPLSAASAAPARAAAVAPSASAVYQKPVMVVIPQAVPRPLMEPAAPIVQSNVVEAAPATAAGGFGNALSIRDLASGAPAAAASWSVPSQRPAIEPIGNAVPTDVNENSSGAFNPGWTTPSAGIDSTRYVPSVPVAPPRSVAYPQTTSGRYAQPAWVAARAKPSPTIVQRPAQPAPLIVSPPAAR
ncbi:MAG TPA: hypothetical protein VFG04_17375 [Planctomycetaceae bacterium]|jgi:hypothetical protein|nr:hypothetical protein [Planctomycetaceae bacterium]